MMGDRLQAGLTVALFAYALLLQGIVTVYAQTAMAADAGMQTVICAPSGMVDHDIDHPLKDLAHDCCSILCKTACAAGPVLPDTATPVDFKREPVLTRWAFDFSAQAPPLWLRVVPEARGPPAISA